MGSKDSAALKNMDAVLGEIRQRLGTVPQEWLQALTANPGSFTDLERTVHHAFQQMADEVVAGLLAQATVGGQFVQAAKKK